MNPVNRLLLVFTLSGLTVAVAAQDHPAMPSGMTHEEHMAQMKKEGDLKEHGDIAMGFDQDKATHHFTLTTTGGLIAVSANDPGDQTTREQIRTHLRDITQAFASGNFEKPLITHGEVPAGAADMQRLKGQISYTFESTDRGGAVWITTSNNESLKAVHAFLRYQIREHSTGDPLTVQK